MASLLSRRQSMRCNLSLHPLDMDCVKVSNKEELSPASTVASSVERSCSKSATTEHGPCFVQPQRGLSRRALSRPSINIDLVREYGMPVVEQFAHSQSKRLSEQFEGISKLGEGSCAVVYRATTRRNQQQVALKVMRINDEEHLQNARNEYEVLQQISHPNIIKVHDFFTYAGGAVLVEELYVGGSLQTTIDDAKEGCIEEKCACQLFFQLVDAVAYLHSHGIIHRDIKPQNILISHNMTGLRLVDFNTSRLVVDGGGLTMTGTPAFMPPEVLKGNSPSESSDVWASGLCLHFMLMGDLPSRRGGIRVQLEGAKWELVSKTCKDILRKCLEPRQDVRPPAHDVLKYATSQTHP